MGDAAWQLQVHGSVQLLRLAGIAELNDIPHAFSTRIGGSSHSPFDTLNLGLGSGDIPGRVAKNRALFLSCLEGDPKRLQTVKQIHSSKVIVLKNEHAVTDLMLQGDALITDQTGLWLGILTADCYPILLADPGRRVVAAVHAGWRGTASGVVTGTIAAMQQHWGCAPPDLFAMVGPGIGSCCYQVGSEVFQAFVDSQPPTKSWFIPDRRSQTESGPLWRLDLAAAIQKQLDDGGVRQERVFVLGRCTACEPGLFFSYRREGQVTGRMLSVIGLNPSSAKNSMDGYKLC